MARVRPFIGVYYDSSAGAVSDLIAPPYDVIEPAQAKKLAEKSPYNVIHITYCLEPGSNFYQRAGELFHSWLEQKVLEKAPAPAIYFYQVDFSYLFAGKEQRVSRQGFFAQLGLSEYQKGEVLPHERTMSAPKKDRLELLRSVSANLSPIFCLYSDPGLELIARLQTHPPDPPIFEFEDELGFQHKFFAIYEKRIFDDIAQHLKTQPVYIADGHHRYETALAFYQELLSRNDPRAESAGWILSYFCPIEEPGLVIFPYHRLLKGLDSAQLEGLMERISEYFITHLLFPQLSLEIRSKVLALLEEIKEKEFLMIDSGQRVWLLRFKSELFPEFASQLGVEILEELVLKRILMLSQDELLKEAKVHYETSEEKIMQEVFSRQYQLAFLLKPISVEKIIQRAGQRKTMPEKSTYFYPKLPSGLIFRIIEPESS